MQGFLHWLGTGDIEVKRDFDLRGRDELRVMTVHGAKGLQAPIVFLPDTMGGPPPQAPPVLWTEDGLPLWRAHDGCGGAVLDGARALAQQKKAEEYRRLLYVAMTRAEDRLYVCGWHGKRAPPPDCWYGLVARPAWRRRRPARRGSFAFAAPIADGWEGQGPVASSRRRACRPEPDWRRWRSPAGPDRSPCRSGFAARPSRSRARRSPWCPRGPSARSRRRARPWAMMVACREFRRRSSLVHRLLPGRCRSSTPACARARRGNFLARPVHALDPAAQEALLAETLGVLDDPETAPLFGPGSLAEVPVVGVLAGRVLSGRIDRLLVTDDAVLIVDYKTLRPVPPDEDRVPALYIDQLRAYRAAVAQIYPGREVRCALHWTDGPTLMPVSQRRLALDARPIDAKAGRF